VTSHLESFIGKECLKPSINRKMATMILYNFLKEKQNLTKVAKLEA